MDLDVAAAPRARAAPKQAVEQPAAAPVEAETAENVLEVDAAEQVLGREAGDAGVAARPCSRCWRGGLLLEEISRAVH